MKHTTVHGVDLAFVDRGVGLPVVLVHGFPLDHTMWNAQLDALRRRFRAIAPDLRGFGRSGVTPGVVTMEQHSDDLAGLLDALEIREPVVLCGLSMGGYVAFQFWRRHAERLRGLVLCDTRAAADTPEAAAGRLQSAERVLREGPQWLAENMQARLFAAATVQQRPEVVSAVRAMVMGTDPEGIAATLRGMAERPDATASLAEIACPTLVIVGQEDVVSPPAEVRAMAAAIPAARLVEIAGSGHMTPMERPAEFNAAIRKFLATL